MLPNRVPRLYHSGETSDLGFAVRSLRAREPETPLLAIGVSLGGNVLLKWLGENPAQREDCRRGGLDAARPRRERTLPRDLRGAPLRRELSEDLRRKACKRTAFRRRRKIDIPRSLLGADVLGVRRRQRAAARLTGADDYYRRSSSSVSARRRHADTVPLGCGRSVPAREALERAAPSASQAIDFVVTAQGGHIGWVTGPWPWRPCYFAEESVVAWLAARIA